MEVTLLVSATSASGLDRKNLIVATGHAVQAKELIGLATGLIETTEQLKFEANTQRFGDDGRDT